MVPQSLSDRGLCQSLLQHFYTWTRPHQLDTFELERELQGMNRTLQIGRFFPDQEAVLSAMHRDLAKLLEETSDGLLVFLQGVIVFSNSAFARQIGVESPQELLGTTVEDLVDPIDLVAWRAHIAGESKVTPVRMMRRDAGKVYVELSPARPVSLAEDAIILMTHDVTERHRLEQRILDMAVRERRRIAYDLHDGLGQCLTAVSLQIKLIRSMVDQGDLPLFSDLDSVANLVRESIEQTRRLAKGLDLMTTSGEGLTTALRQLAIGAETIFPVSCRVTGDVVEMLDNDNRSGQLYRIVQEAVNNAVQHGSASEVEINLRLKEGKLRLAVIDNGGGLHISPDQKGMGLRIMEHRAELAGGDCAIGPAEGGGTQVVCVVPASDLKSQS